MPQRTSLTTYNYDLRKKKKSFLIVWVGVSLLDSSQHYSFLLKSRTREGEPALCSLHKPYPWRRPGQGKRHSDTSLSVSCPPLPRLLRQSAAPPSQPPTQLWMSMWGPRQLLSSLLRRSQTSDLDTAWQPVEGSILANVISFLLGCHDSLHKQCMESYFLLHRTLSITK